VQVFVTHWPGASGTQRADGQDAHRPFVSFRVPAEPRLDPRVTAPLEIGERRDTDCRVADTMTATISLSPPGFIFTMRVLAVMWV
jgi:hypothetical protein